MSFKIPNDTNEPCFGFPNKILTESFNLEEFWIVQTEKLKQKCEEFEGSGSGWPLDSLLCLRNKIHKYTHPVGHLYISLDKYTSSKQACINAKNNDDKCLMWSVLPAFHPALYSPEKISHYKPYVNELNFDGIEFPVKLYHISKFEKQNKINIVVLGYKKESKKYCILYNNRNKPHRKTHAWRSLTHT